MNFDTLSITSQTHRSSSIYSTMKYQTIFAVGLKIFFWFCKLFGFCPFHYNSRRKRYNWTWIEIIYSISIWANFCYFYTTSGLSAVARLNPLVVVAFFYLTMSTITMVFLIQCAHANQLANLSNKTYALLQELKPFCSSLSNVHAFRYGMLFLCKIILTSGIAQVATIVCCSLIGKMISGSIDYFVIFIVSVAYFMQTLVPNIFYTFILGISMHYRQLNNEVEKIVAEVRRFVKDKHVIQSANQFNHLIQRLDCIATLHGKLTIHSKNVNDIFSLQLLITISNFFAIILIEVSHLKKLSDLV